MSEVTIKVADKPTLDTVNTNVSKILNALAPFDTDVYGFIDHGDILDPAQRIEYIGANKNFTPLSINLEGNHQANYGSWADFPIIKANKPYMVKADGTPDYELSSTDYTKKVDGITASDVANTSYTGGAFSWLIKHYKWEYNVGNDRYVFISMEKKSDNFKPVGFIDDSDKELEGVWIPMFYGTEITQSSTDKLMTLASGYPIINKTTDQQKSLIDNFSSRARFFGGAIVNVIADLLTMFAKNSDFQAAYGYGNMNGYVESSEQHYGMKENATTNAGQFYGSKTGTEINRVFHSMVLATQNSWQRDPYTMLINGRLKVSPNYKYDLTGTNYVDTNIIYGFTGGWYWPSKLAIVPEFGSVPNSAGGYAGSTELGYGDGFYLNNATTSVGLRFAACYYGRPGGVRCLALTHTAGRPDWDFGASALLLPPVGVSP